jgi:predicted acyltransferase
MPVCLFVRAPCLHVKRPSGKTVCVSYCGFRVAEASGADELSDDFVFIDVPQAGTGVTQSHRLVSLDAMRGAAIAAMILVNSPGRWSLAFAQLKHAPWPGWTFADCIFPAFLFIMGVAIVLSPARQARSSQGSRKVIPRILRRSFLLFALGLMLNGFPSYDLTTLRIPGVLQRIAVCYLAAAFIALYTRPVTQAGLLAAILVGTNLLLAWIPVPGAEPGSLPLTPENSIVSYIDGLLLQGHLWYNYRPYDPEGILSTIPAIGSTLVGVLTGHWLGGRRSIMEKAAGMLAAGILMLLSGVVWSLWLPINKGIWTSSYAVFMAGMSLVCLSVCCWLMEGKNWRRPFAPLQIFGMNAVTAYLFSEIAFKTLRSIELPQSDGSSVSLRRFIFQSLFGSLANQKLASLMFSLCFLFLVWLLVWGMWKKRWILKL